MKFSKNCFYRVKINSNLLYARRYFEIDTSNYANLSDCDSYFSAFFGEVFVIYILKVYKNHVVFLHGGKFKSSFTEASFLDPLFNIIEKI